MKKDEEILVLAIENIYPEDSVIGQRTLNNEEQLLLVEAEANQHNDSLKSVPFDCLPWYRRPSVNSPPYQTKNVSANQAGRYIGS